MSFLGNEGSLDRDLLGGRNSLSGSSGTIQLGERRDANLGDGFGHIDRFLAADFLGVLAGAKIAFDLHVGALGERCCEFRKLAEDDAAVPGGLALSLSGLRVSPAAFGGEREDRERRVGL